MLFTPPLYFFCTLPQYCLKAFSAQLSCLCFVLMQSVVMQLSVLLDTSWLLIDRELRWGGGWKKKERGSVRSPARRSRFWCLQGPLVSCSELSLALLGHSWCPPTLFGLSWMLSRCLLGVTLASLGPLFTVEKVPKGGCPERGG